MIKLVIAAFALSFLTLTSCKDEKATTTTQVDNTTTPESSVKVEDTSENSATSPSSTTTNALAKKMIGNYEASITKAKVIGDILSVELRVKNTNGGEDRYSVGMNSREIYYIEDQTGKKVSVLRDDKGDPLVNPISGGYLRFSASAESEGIATIKFPAPSAETKTISFTFPEMGSFDEVPVQR